MPKEIIALFFCELSPKDIGRCVQVCKLWKAIIDSSDSLHKQVLENDWKQELVLCTSSWKKALRYPKIHSFEGNDISFKLLEDVKVLPKRLFTGKTKSFGITSRNHKGLTKIPKEIGLLQNLTIIDLNTNRIKLIPLELFNITSLTRIYLYGNKITEIPPQISKLTALERLSVFENRLSSLPIEISVLTNLETLHAHTNNISHVPEQYSTLTKLIHFVIHSNPIQTIPYQLSTLTNLIHKNNEFFYERLQKLNQ